MQRPSTALQPYSVTPAEPFCADSKHASITCCVFSTHIGHSSLSLREKTWLAKLRNMMVFCAVAWPSSAGSETDVGVGVPAAVGTRTPTSVSDPAELGH